MRGVIVEEFQGEEPSAAAMERDGLFACARSRRARGRGANHAGPGSGRCAARACAAESADGATARLGAAGGAGRNGADRGALAGARFRRERRSFETLSRELGAMRSDDVHAAMETALPGWRARFDAAVRARARRERQTYFNEANAARGL